MAKEGKPIQVNDYDFSKNGWDNYGKWFDDTINSLTKNKDPNAKDLTGSVVKFPYADGYAYYQVTKHRPLTLSVILIGDAWQALPATIRGTTEQDIRDQLFYAMQQEKFWSKR